jgi:hypothetical protein
MIETLTVYWPSGATTELHDVAADQVLGIPEQFVCWTSEDDLALDEGAQAEVRLRLNSPPGHSITVDVARASGDSSVQVDATRVFSPATWQDWQTFVISVDQDADRDDGQAVVRCSAAEFSRPTDIAVTVNDDDKLGIETSVSELDMQEDSTAAFGVR